jgi:hypothetical protein
MNKLPPLYRDWGFWLAVVGGGILFIVLVLELMRVLGDLGVILGLVGIAFTLIGTIMAASWRSVATLYDRIDSRLVQTEDRLALELKSNRTVLEDILNTLRQKST